MRLGFGGRDADGFEHGGIEAAAGAEFGQVGAQAVVRGADLGFEGREVEGVCVGGVG